MSEDDDALRVVNAKRREQMQRSADHYGQFLDQAEDYLHGKRGITVEEGRSYGLGYVPAGEALDGDEQYVGRLVIPYRTRNGVVQLKYRCTGDHDNCKKITLLSTDPDTGKEKWDGHEKYMQPAGVDPSLYNVEAFHADSSVIIVTEGEADAMAVELRTGLPAVGYPGVGLWASRKFRHWRLCFDPYTTVYIIADGDEPGRSSAKRLLKDLQNGIPVYMPDGHDATSYLMEYGTDALLDKLGYGVDYDDIPDDEDDDEDLPDFD